MAQVLTELRSKGPVNGIVLDIRGNDGGDDEQGAAVVEFFTPPYTKPYLYEHASYSNRLLSVAEEGNLKRYMSSKDLAEFGNIAGEALDGYGVEEEYSLNIDPEHLKAYSDPLLPEHVAGFEGAFQGPVVCMVNRYCDSTCEGIAYGLKQRAARGEASGSAEEITRTRSKVVGFEGTLGSFGMSGASVVMPGDFTLNLPFGRSTLSENPNDIQLDSDHTGQGGVMPNAPLAMNSSNLIAFVAQKPVNWAAVIKTGKGDIELEWALHVLHGLF